jgi:hypothetical protein
MQNNNTTYLDKKQSYYTDVHKILGFPSERKAGISLMK